MHQISNTDLRNFLKQFKHIKIGDNLYSEINVVLGAFLEYLIKTLCDQEQFDVPTLEKVLLTFYTKTITTNVVSKNTLKSMEESEIGLATDLPANLDSILALPEISKVISPCYLPGSRAMPRVTTRWFNNTTIRRLVKQIALNIALSTNKFNESAVHDFIYSKNQKLYDAFNDCLGVYLYRTIFDCQHIIGDRPLSGEIYREVIGNRTETETETSEQSYSDIE